MARRIDIELTSTRPDGTWTWRAAGAKAPKGVLDGSLLHEGAKTGDVLKAEADFEIEGITIVSVSAPKADGRNEPQRIEILGPSRPDAPGVTTQLVGRQERRGPVRRRDGDQHQRGERTPRDAGRGPDRRHAAGTDRPERPARQGGAPGDRGDRPDRRRRPEGARDGEQSTGRTGGANRRARPDESGTGSKDGARRPPRRTEKSGGGARGASPRQEDRGAKRLNPAHVHRDAILESLAPEQRPIAEEVLRGGIPAVRTALHLEREKAEAEGRPAPNTDQLVAMAEDLLPKLKAAEWRDRAEAAVKAADEISLRDLRSVVAGTDAARDEETRSLAASLREALDRRLETQRTHWSEEIIKQLDEGRVVRALRLSARPPEPAARLEEDLSKRLAVAAGESMSPSASPDLWLALLDAAVASPVRRTIIPAGLPSETSPEVRQAALQQSSRIPALATMLGVSIPPPPVRKAPPERRPAPARRPEAETTRRPEAESARRPEAESARRPEAETARRPEAETARRPDAEASPTEAASPAPEAQASPAEAASPAPEAEETPPEVEVIQAPTPVEPTHASTSVEPTQASTSEAEAAPPPPASEANTPATPDTATEPAGDSAGGSDSPEESPS